MPERATEVPSGKQCLLFRSTLYLLLSISLVFLGSALVLALLHRPVGASLLAFGALVLAVLLQEDRR